MKKGESPPKGVRELVLKLAGSNPRPTNKEIQETVERKCGCTTSLRTIARYCRETDLPTSSGRASNNKLPVLQPEIKPQPVSQQLISQIKKLKKKIGRLTEIPLPEKRFYPDRDELQAADAAMKQGDSKVYLSLLTTLTIPQWWYPGRTTKIRSYISHEEEAVLDRLFELRSSLPLKGLIEDWEKAAEKYRRLKELDVEAGGTREAYVLASHAKEKLDAGLAKAVVALY